MLLRILLILDEELNTVKAVGLLVLVFFFVLVIAEIRLVQQIFLIFSFFIRFEARSVKELNFTGHLFLLLNESILESSLLKTEGPSFVLQRFLCDGTELSVLIEQISRLVLP